MTNLSGKTCLLDTNVLVALINKQHSSHSKATLLFERLISGEFKAVISSQNLFELAAVLVHGLKIPRRETAEDIKLLVQETLLDIIYPDFRVMDTFMENLKIEKNLHIADLYLISTSLVFGIDVIISADESLQKLASSAIVVYNPFK